MSHYCLHSRYISDHIFLSLDSTSTDGRYILCHFYPIAFQLRQVQCIFLDYIFTSLLYAAYGGHLSVAIILISLYSKYSRHILCHIFTSLGAIYGRYIFGPHLLITVFYTWQVYFLSHFNLIVLYSKHGKYILCHIFTDKTSTGRTKISCITITTKHCEDNS